MKLLISLFVLVIISSCKKESNNQACWQVIDQLGNDVGTVCNKTEAAMLAQYQSPCAYYRTGGEKFCWLIGGSQFLKDATEEKLNHTIRCFYSATPSVTKVACDYCQAWYTREKRIYKPNNTFSYSQVRSEQFCGDTARTLFQGKQVTIRETGDSLIAVQFSNNGSF